MNSPIVARLTVTRQDESRIIVEVHADATFHHFYAFFKQQGRKRSTRKFIRWGSRNEGLEQRNAHRQIPGLHAVALQFVHLKFGSPVVSTRTRYTSKRAYKKLIRMAPDQLGLSKVRSILDQRTIRVQLKRTPTFKLVEKLSRSKLHAGAMR